ncbi:MAG: hypothetical protein AB1832_18880, partial [Pseudomonadota bacterium]
LPRAATLHLPSAGRQFIDRRAGGIRRIGLGYVIGRKQSVAAFKQVSQGPLQRKRHPEAALTIRA